MSCFPAYSQFLKAYKNIYHIFRKQKSKNVLTCIFGFNNQFIKVMRTRPIFQNFQKKYFVFL